MNKIEFLAGLRKALEGMPPEEIENAIEYYREYFDEAGPEREQELLKELGSPASVAAQLRVDIALRKMDGPTPPSAKKGISTIWVIILAICAAPIALPVAITIIAVAFAMVVTVIAVVLALFITVVALLISGVAVSTIAFPMFTTHFPAGLVCFGVGLAMAGAALLMIVLMVLCARLGFRGVAYLISRMSKRKKGGTV